MDDVLEETFKSRGQSEDEFDESEVIIFRQLKVTSTTKLTMKIVRILQFENVENELG